MSSEPKTDAIKTLEKWVVWTPVFSALIYFYSWLFEYVTCYKLNVPASLIEPTLGSVLFFAGVLIFTISAGGLFLTGIYFLLKDAGWKSTLIALPSLMILCIVAFFINNWELPKAETSRMVMLGTYIWITLLICGSFIQVFNKYKTWNKIFNLMLVDGSNELNSFIKIVKKYYVFALLLLLLPITWLTGLSYVLFNPPDSRILGKEPLILVKKYGDVIICRYLDSANNRLRDTIKVIKIESEGFSSKIISPAPKY